MIRTACLVAVAILTAGGALHAQAIGDRVRIKRVSQRYERRLTGELRLLSPDSALVSLSLQPPVSKMFAISQLEVYAGKRTRAVEGAVIGGAIGAGIGYAVADFLAPGCVDWCLSRPTTMRRVVPIGIVAGLLIGRAGGKRYTTDRWVSLVKR